ncbi:MAG TPA: alpha/beta hydrolase-fold protein [Fimbriiglobus sp.]|jgi:endo-1,4-beta-xylanase
MRFRFLPAVVLLVIQAGLGCNHQKQREVKWNNPDGPNAPGLEHKSYMSPSMETEVGYCVYTPPGYKESRFRYPVIYFLHGAGGSESSDAGGFSELVAKAIADKDIPPVICVFPNGGMSGYADKPETKVMGETIVIKELIPKIDADYRTQSTRESRVICGFSMGGGGAVRLALKYPDLFSAAASWAGAFGRVDATDWPGDHMAWAEKNRDRLKDKVRFLFVVGDEDMTLAGNKSVVDKLKELGIAMEYKELKGVNHNLGTYYSQTGRDFVKFLGREFQATEK